MREAIDLPWAQHPVQRNSFRSSKKPPKSGGFFIHLAKKTQKFIEAGFELHVTASRPMPAQPAQIINTSRQPHQETGPPPSMPAKRSKKLMTKPRVELIICSPKNRTTPITHSSTPPTVRTSKVLRSMFCKIFSIHILLFAKGHTDPHGQW